MSVILIDPNNESDNTNPKMINSIPQYQDMYIFAELVVKSRGRTVIVTNNSGLYTLDRSGSQTDIVANFMGNNQDNSPNNPNYLKFTTNWYDGSSAKGKQYEGFGISAIKVVINSSFIPQINIQFIDLRGLAFFNQENSPYRAMFNFPPPIFYLTIKGYYGKPLTYQIHLVKYTSEFKAENGNFVIDAQFIAMTYAPLTDILFRYVVNFPLIDEIIPSNPNPGVFPVNTYDLILKLKSLMSQYSDKPDSSIEMKAYHNTLTTIEKINGLIFALQSYKSNPILAKGIPLLFTGHHNLVSDKIDLTEITSITDYDTYIKSIPDNGISNKTKDRLLIGYLVSNNVPADAGVLPHPNNLFTPDYLPPDSSAKSPSNPSINSSLTKLDDYKKSLLTSAELNLEIKAEDIPAAIPVNKFLNDTYTTYAILDITTYYEKLYKKSADLQTEMVATMSTINTKINNAVLQTLGMNPTIYNVFKVILGDVDKFFNILRRTSYTAEFDHHVRNRGAILRGDFQDVKNTINPESTKIFAFPLIIDKQTMLPCNQVKETRIAPVKLGLAINDIFPEIKLVYQFINTFITQRNLTVLYDMRSLQNADGTFMWIPISPVDSILGTDNTKSPYYGVDTSNGGLAPQAMDAVSLPPALLQSSSEINLSSDSRIIQVLKIILKRFYILTQNSFPYKFYEKKDSSKYTKFFSESEAINLTASIFNSEYADLILQISRQYAGDPKAFYDFVKTNIPDLYSFTPAEHKYFNILDGSNLGEPKPNGDIYVDKYNINFHGFKICTDAISARVPIESDTKIDSGNPVTDFLNSLILSGWKKMWTDDYFESSLKFTLQNVLFLTDDNVKGTDDSLGIKSDTRFLATADQLHIVFSEKDIAGIDDTLVFRQNNNSKTRNRIKVIEYMNNNNKGNEYFTDIGNISVAATTLTLFNNIVKVWANELCWHDTNIYETIINYEGSNYNLKLSALMILSSFGYALSPFNIYPAALNTTFFSVPAAIEVPSYLPYYMGALIDILPGTSEYNDIYNFFVSGAGRKLNSSGALIFADIIDLNNQLADSDKGMVKDIYDAFVGSSMFKNIVIGLYELYHKINDVPIASLPPTADQKLIAYTKELTPTNIDNTGYFNVILQPLMEKYAIIDFSQITFKRNANAQIGYKSIETTNKIPVQKTINDTYFSAFFNALYNKTDKKKQALKKQKEEDDKLAGDDDIITQTYYSFKNINDKWLSSPKSINRQIGYPFNEVRSDNSIPQLIDLFAFVDRAMNPIGNTMINPEILIDLLDDPNVSVFTVLTQLLSMNGFEFFPLQNFMSYANNNEWKDCFKIDTNGTITPSPAFVCMYIGGSSSYPTGIETFGGQYKDDGIVDISNPGVSDFDAQNCPPIKADDNQKETNPNFPWGQVRAFRVKFGEQNQSMFNDIKIDSKEYPETNESIKILSRLAGDQKLQAPTPKGQNLYNMYENRSYRATVTGLGNAMIQPTQYFQLENVPLFNGAYIILGVEHDIVPNKMTTSFYGTKVLKYPIPRVLQPSVVLGFMGGNTNDTNPYMTSETNTTQGKEAVTISTERLSGPKNGLDSVFGIDVSKAQGRFDWETAVHTVNPGEPKLDYAIIKISQGTFNDSQGKNNANGAQRVGLKIGYYHYADQFTIDDKNAIIADATAQAKTFINAIVTQSLPKPDFPLMLDMENYDEKNKPPKYWSLNKDNNDLWINTFITVLKNSGYETILYGGKEFYDKYTNNNFSTQSLWHAQYLYHPETSNPTVANGWQKNGWTIWQFSSQGKISGYLGNVDLNAMKKNYFDSNKA